MPIPTELFATIMQRLDAHSAADAAAQATKLWQALFAKFAPLIGPLSAELLFRRSLATHETAFPWLPRIPPALVQAAFPAFERSLEGRTVDEIVAANGALLSTYAAVLSDLIGMGLACKFLGATFASDETNKNI